MQTGDDTCVAINNCATIYYEIPADNLNYIRSTLNATEERFNALCVRLDPIKYYGINYPRPNVGDLLMFMNCLFNNVRARLRVRKIDDVGDSEAVAVLGLQLSVNRLNKTKVLIRKGSHFFLEEEQEKLMKQKKMRNIISRNVPKAAPAWCRGETSSCPSQSGRPWGQSRRRTRHGPC